MHITYMRTMWFFPYQKQYPIPSIFLPILIYSITALILVVNLSVKSLLFKSHCNILGCSRFDKTAYTQLLQKTKTFSFT